MITVGAGHSNLSPTSLLLRSRGVCVILMPNLSFRVHEILSKCLSRRGWDGTEWRLVGMVPGKTGMVGNGGRPSSPCSSLLHTECVDTNVSSGFVMCFSLGPFDLFITLPFFLVCFCFTCIPHPTPFSDCGFWLHTVVADCQGSPATIPRQPVLLLMEAPSSIFNVPRGPLWGPRVDDDSPPLCPPILLPPHLVFCFFYQRNGANVKPHADS